MNHMFSENTYVYDQYCDDKPILHFRDNLPDLDLIEWSFSFTILESFLVSEIIF